MNCMMAENEDKGLDSLNLWKMAVVFAVKVCEQILPLFPADEKWVLSIQLRRAVQSIPANIAEGFGRHYYQEGVRFCYIARGSLEETYSHLVLARQLGYLPEDYFKTLINEINTLRRMLSGYINFLKTSKRGATEPGSQSSINDAVVEYEFSITEEPPEAEFPS